MILIFKFLLLDFVIHEATYAYSKREKRFHISFFGYFPNCYRDNLLVKFVLMVAMQLNENEMGY